MIDLISRQEVLTFIEKSVSEYGNRYSVDMLNMWGLFAQVVKEMPPAQQWIPCSERLPTKTGHYLCSFKKPNRIDRIYVGLVYWTGGRWYGYVGDEINAWMPLPLPYKEDSDETD